MHNALAISVSKLTYPGDLRCTVCGKDTEMRCDYHHPCCEEHLEDYDGAPFCPAHLAYERRLEAGRNVVAAFAQVHQVLMAARELLPEDADVLRRQADWAVHYKVSWEKAFNGEDDAE